MSQWVDALVVAEWCLRGDRWACDYPHVYWHIGVFVVLLVLVAAVFASLVARVLR
jgi:hypothetical protein